MNDYFLLPTGEADFLKGDESDSVLPGFSTMFRRFYMELGTTTFHLSESPSYSLLETIELISERLNLGIFYRSILYRTMSLSDSLT